MGEYDYGVYRAKEPHFGNTVQQAALTVVAIFWQQLAILQSERGPGFSERAATGGGTKTLGQWNSESLCNIQKFGWGGRIRTFTGLINSEVPYQLDHAPAASEADFGGTSEVGSATRRVGGGSN